MSRTAADTFAAGFLKGYCDVIGALLTADVPFTADDAEVLTPDRLLESLSTYGVVLHARIQGGGGIAVLMNGGDAMAIAQLVMGEEPTPEETPSVEDLAGYRDVFDPCMGGGVSHFKEAYGRELVLQGFAVSPGGAEAVGLLAEVLGDAAAAASFRAPILPSIQGGGVLLFSRQLEDVIPQEKQSMDAGKQEASEPLLSQDEVGDILSQVTGGQPAASPPPPAPEVPPARMPSNIEMVLDIRLVATARLGRVEMPISEILALGPGSIIEVGHLVDEPVELLVNDKLVARGDVVVVDEKFGLRITEIISPQARIQSLGG